MRFEFLMTLVLRCIQINDYIIYELLKIKKIMYTAISKLHFSYTISAVKAIFSKWFSS